MGSYYYSVNKLTRKEMLEENQQGNERALVERYIILCEPSGALNTFGREYALEDIN